MRHEFVLINKDISNCNHKPYVNMDYDIRFNFSMVDMNQTTTELQLVLDNNLNLRHKRIPSCH
jgi:uncharacterized protein YueI